MESLFYNFPHHYFIKTGDFNLNTFDWSIYPNIQHHNLGSILFNCYINFLNLKQINFIQNYMGRTLDCIFLNSDVEFISINYLLFGIPCTNSRKLSPSFRTNYKNLLILLFIIIIRLRL